ncbi:MULTISPECIES: IS66 family insertion sequence element accessory protein TnpB [Paenibacillus]|uniref:IS66 family insertion sequence element accessory protein TnpB n=1 Tax=Paenibacillus TaxID=44249 RepID=UPI0009D66712
MKPFLVVRYRSLERGTFQWPGPGDSPVALSFRELRWLLDGLSLHQRQAHKQISAQTVV